MEVARGHSQYGMTSSKGAWRILFLGKEKSNQRNFDHYPQNFKEELILFMRYTIYKNRHRPERCHLRLNILQSALLSFQAEEFRDFSADAPYLQVQKCSGH